MDHGNVSAKLWGYQSNTEQKQKAKVVSKIPQKKFPKIFSRVGFLRKSNPLFRHEIFQTV